MVSASKAPSPPEATGSRRALIRITGLIGVLLPFLTILPASQMARKEPEFQATASEVLEYYQSLNTVSGSIWSYLFTLGLFALLWYMLCWSSLLRSVEPAPAWRSTIAAGSATVAITLVLVGVIGAGALRADEIDPKVAQTLFDLGNASFANAWVALGSFAILTGWVAGEAGLLPRWSAWWIALVGIGLVLSRAVWLEPVFWAPYLLFWLWILVSSILLLRARVPAQLNT
jgi:hypothetical protein